MRRLVLCVLASGSLVLTAMCCVSVWHNIFHPKIRPDLIDAAGLVEEAFQRNLWLAAGTDVHDWHGLWGAIGWNRRNLVILFCILKPQAGEELPAEYWQGLKISQNALWHTKLRSKQAATLKLSKKTRTRTDTYWCFIPLWLAWAVVSAYPVLVISKAVLVRRIRRKRGQCLACGYDLQGNVSRTCPECGGTCLYRPRQGA